MLSVLKKTEIARQRKSLVLLLLMKSVQLLKPPAIKTLLQRDDNVFGSQLNSWYETWTLERQLLAVRGSVSPADIFLVSLDSACAGQ